MLVKLGGVEAGGRAEEGGEKEETAPEGLHLLHLALSFLSGRRLAPNCHRGQARPQLPSAQQHSAPLRAADSAWETAFEMARTRLVSFGKNIC